MAGRAGAAGMKDSAQLLLDNERLKEFVGVVEEVHGSDEKSDFDVLNTLGRYRNIKNKNKNKKIYFQYKLLHARR